MEVRFDQPRGARARRALARAARNGDQVGAAVAYPLFDGDPPLMSSGEIRDRVRFQLRELSRLALPLRLRWARPEGPLAAAAGRDPRVALAVAHGVQASFLRLVLVAEPGSRLERAARRLGVATRAG